MKIKHLKILFFIAVNLFSFSNVWVKDCPTIGAIRWDAWHGGVNGNVGAVVEKSLAPEQYVDRAPFCSKIEKGILKIDCVTSEAMEKEIGYAALAQLDYWAFLLYPNGNPMGLSLERYLESGDDRIKFSVILTFASLTKPSGSYSKNIQRVVDYIQEKRYQKVLGGKPLVFFLLEGAYKGNGNDDFISKMMNDIRNELKIRAIPAPYFVLLDGNIKDANVVVKQYGFDALSAYAVSNNGKGASYSDLTKYAADFWNRASASGNKVVPIAMMGWDRRPRVTNPVPWEKSNVRADEMDYFYERPKPNELASHIIDSMSWVQAHPDVAEANTVLIYAWNENDEGGWLVPTLGEGDARVKALGLAKKTIKNCH